MTEYLKLIIAIVGGNAVLLAAVTWLLQKLIGQQLSKDLEGYKAELTTMTYEHEVEFRKRHDVLTLQKYQYFLPFKFCADEFRRRLIHIEDRLVHTEGEKHENMLKRFQQEFEGKPIEWFFSDKIGSDGGYFITSTIYMNCVLFSWIQRIQLEYPFIPLQIAGVSQHVKERYTAYCQEDQFLSPIHDECHIDDIIKNIKVAISRQYGIPYGLHESLGDYIFDHPEKRVMNYAEFCQEMADDTKRLKYTPMISFWTGIVSSEGNAATERLKKMSILILILEYFQYANIRE